MRLTSRTCREKELTQKNTYSRGTHISSSEESKLGCRMRSQDKSYICGGGGERPWGRTRGTWCPSVHWYKELAALHSRLQHKIMLVMSTHKCFPVFSFSYWRIVDWQAWINLCCITKWFSDSLATKERPVPKNPMYNFEFCRNWGPSQVEDSMRMTVF